MGGASSTNAIEDASGNDISSHGDKATNALKQGQVLNGYFSNVPVYQGIGKFDGEILAAGYFASKTVTPPVVPRLRLASTNALLASDPPSSAQPLTAASKPAQDFVHQIHGTRDDLFSYLVKTSTIYTHVECSLATKEKVQVQAQAYETPNALFALTLDRPKEVKITLWHEIGVTQDSTTVTFSFTTQAAGKLTFRPRPGLQLIDISPGCTELCKASVNITSMRNGLRTSNEYSLDERVPKCKAFRLKFNPAVSDCGLVLGILDREEGGDLSSVTTVRGTSNLEQST
jgi:hypothetical protein